MCVLFFIFVCSIRRFTYLNTIYTIFTQFTQSPQLVDEQRKYFKAVKDFQDECNKNDWLTSKLEQITRAG